MQVLAPYGWPCALIGAQGLSCFVPPSAVQLCARFSLSSNGDNAVAARRRVLLAKVSVGYSCSEP